MTVSLVNARRVLGALVVSGAVIGGAFAAERDHTNPATVASKAALYAPGPAEGESLASLESYSAHRMTYPTGHFDARWLLKAARHDRLIRSEVPVAAPSSAAAPDRAGSARALVANAFTSLGPQPENTESCREVCFTFGPVSGRVNTIAIDQTTTTPGQVVAYFGSDGGGVWKSTNCCTPATTWSVTTDTTPGINSMSIDDITIDPDPNNHNTIYAGTGDLTFGSLSFGSAGVLKSTDAGATWQVLGASQFAPVYTPDLSFPQYQAVGKVRVDPNNSSNVVAGTKTGLFLSYDAGANWTGPCVTNSFSSQRQDITALILRDDGATTKVIAAVGARGYGTKVQPNLGQNGANGIYSADLPASGCPTGWQLISRSDNGWPGQGAGSGVPCGLLLTAPGAPGDVCPANTNKVGRIDMAIAPSNSQVMYAEVQAIDYHIDCTILQGAGAAGSNGCFLGLWRTGDGGATWTLQAGPAEMNGLVTPAAGCGEEMPQHWYNQGITVDPLDPDHIFFDGIDIWASTDGGDTITDITCGYATSLVFAAVHVDQHALAFAPPVAGVASTLLAGSDGGMYVSNDANAPPGTESPHFVELNTNINGSTIEFYSGDISMNFATAPTATIVAGAQDNGSSANVWTNPPGPGPAAWSERFGGDGVFSRLEPKLGQRVYVETPGGGLHISVTGPFGAYTTGLAYPWGSELRKAFVFPYEIDKFDCKNRNVNPPTDLTTCDHMIAGSFHVWETTNGGLINTSWISVSPDLTKNTLADRSYISQLAYATTDNRVAIAGTNDGNVQYGFNLGTGVTYSAVCAGLTCAKWVNVTGGNAVLPNRPIQDVAISPADPLVGYAAVGGFEENTPATPGHVYQVTCTADCASFTWQDKSGTGPTALPNIPANSIIVNPKNPAQVFVGTDWGLYITNNVNAAFPTWTRFDAGLPHVMIWDMAIDRGETTLAVFTRSRGAYARLLPGPPTAVTLASFSASARGRQVTLRWKTAEELDTVGFNVWRVGNGTTVKVNHRLIAARAAGRAGGARYRLVDARVRPGAYTYRLQAVAKNGTRTWPASTVVRIRT